MAVRQMLVAGRYRLLEPVGAGGMGRVWLARDEELDRDIAIKELVPPDWMSGAEQDRLRQRTRREARSAARLSHPHVVRVYDIVHAGGLSWIVMEYIRSRSLHQVLEEDGPYDPVAAARIGLAVLTGLDAAHQAGVLHRDVKPHNVLIGVDGRVVLTDFGLATFVGDGGITTPGLIVGSPQYVSPERARDGASTVESDLWSFGATLYAAVEGRSPYARETAMATLGALATEPPDPPTRAGPLVPILAGLLRLDPATRLTAAEVERRLSMIISTERRDTPFVPGQRGGRSQPPEEPGASTSVAGRPATGDHPVVPVSANDRGISPVPPVIPGSATSSGSAGAGGSAGAVGRARLRPLLALPSAEPPRPAPDRAGPAHSSAEPLRSAPASPHPAGYALADLPGRLEPARPHSAARSGAATPVAAGPVLAGPVPVGGVPAGARDPGPPSGSVLDEEGMSGDHFGDATGYPGMGPDGADPGLAADYAALDSWAEDQPLTRFDFIEAEAVFTDDLDEQRPAGDSEPLRVRPNRPPAAHHRPVSDPARRRGPRAVLHAVGRARSGRAARAGHGARIPFPFGSAQARLMACTLLLAVLGTGLLAGYLAHTGAPALRVVMPPVHSVLPVHPSKSHAATSPAPRRSALATSALASGRSTAPRVPATMVAGAAGLSPLVCDAPTPTGLPVAPRRSAARGVSGGSLKAGWSYFTDGSGFHLAVPDGWSYQRIGTTYCFRDPAGTRVMSLAVRRDPGIDPLRVCRAADQRLRKQGVPGYTALRIEVVPLVHRAADWEHRYRGAGGALRHASTRWFVVNGRAYALGWATPADDWAAERSNLHMVQATFYSTAGPADAAQRG